MKRVLFAITLALAMQISCSKQSTDKRPASKANLSEVVVSRSAASDSTLRNKGQVGYISGLDYDPPTKESIKRWKKKVLEEGDNYSYDQLSMYYFDKKDVVKKGIPLKYIEAMIRKRHKSQNYLYKSEYFYYLDNSNIVNKKRLMVKSIKYLKDIISSKDVDEITVTRAKDDLANVYREGIYVKRDTVIANYLYRNSDKNTNLDSIIKARNYKEW